MSNLAQVEFFHVGRKCNPSAEEYAAATESLIEEMLASVNTGARVSSRLKTVVRFYDYTNVLTSLALESKRLRDIDTIFSGEYKVASIPGQVLISRCIQDNAKVRLMLARATLRNAVIELRNSIKVLREIAIEKSDHTFRSAQKDELHEIVEAATGSHAVWLFVFEPNDLLSLTNKSVASAM